MSLQGRIGLVDLIYDAALEPKLWTVVMEQLADLMGGTSGWLSQIVVTDGSGRSEDDPISRGDPYWIKQYVDRFAEVNPFATFTGGDGPKEFLRKWSPCIVTSADQIPRDALSRTEYFNDYMRPQNVASSAMIRLVKSGLATATMNIQCSLQRDHFDAADLEIAASFQPHLIRAFKLGQRLAEERRAAAAIGGSFGRSEHGVFVMDEIGRVRRMNTMAECLVATSGCLRVVQGRLTAQASDDARKLEALINSALSRDAELRTGGAMAIAMPDQVKPLAVMVAPLSAESAWPYRLGRGAIVSASDLNARAPLPEERLRMLFGLTGAESRLALALVNGASPKGAANQFGVNFQTVRNQLSRIYEKTGARSQSDLIGILWRTVGA